MKILTKQNGHWLAAALLAVVSAVQTTQAGVNMRFYGSAGLGVGTEILGTAVTTLYEDSQFPNTPEIVDAASSIANLAGAALIDRSTGFFEWPQPFGTGDSGLNNYGAVISGLFIAPVDGDYKFYVRSDDASALYVTDSPLALSALKPASRPTADAFELGCCGPFEEGEPATDVYTLTAGSGKYLTMVWKEGGGGDWMQVGLSVNGGPIEVLSLGHVQRYDYPDAVPAQDGLRIAGFGPDGVQSEFSVEVVEAQSVSVLVEFDKVMGSTADIPAITWQVDGIVVAGQKGSMLTFRPTADATNDSITRTVRAEVAGFGSAEFEVIVNRDEVPPTLSGAKGSGMPAGIIVNFSEAVDATSATTISNYSFTGQTVTVQSAEMLTDSSVLLKVTEFNTDELILSVSGVTDRALRPNSIAPGSTSKVAILTNLLAYWDFNDPSNPDIALDIAGGNLGQVNGALYTDDAGGFSGDAGDYGMDFGTSSAAEHIFVADASFLNAASGPNTMSVAFWQKNAGTPASSSYWMVAPSSSGTARGNQAHVPWSDQNIYFDTAGCCDGGSQRINGNINSFADFYEGFFLDWHHYVFIKNGNSKQVYIDGKVFIQGTNTGPLPSDFANMTIGSAQNGGNSAAAVMDDFAVFSFALSAEQITGLAEGGSPSALSQPLAAPLAIVTQPASLTVDELTEVVSLSVEVTGGSPTSIGYQWYRNDEMIPGANRATYSFGPAQLADNGAEFYAVAFNLDGTYTSMTSAEATVSVSVRNTPPSVVSVSGNPFNSGITMNFDTPVNISTATSNFTVAPVGGGSNLSVSSASLSADGKSITLSTAQQASKQKYTVTIGQVADLAATPNVATGLNVSYLSLEKRPGGATALMYTAASGATLGYFPIEQRGIGAPRDGFGPFGGPNNFQNIQQGLSSIITYAESPNSGNINTTRVNARDNYGQIIFGWLKPSVTGKYIIAMAVDDNAELYLSSDEDPGNSTLVASEGAWNGDREYNDGTKDTNWTEVLDLVAEQEYYFELYASEGGGGDNAALAWTFTTDGNDPEGPPANGSNPISGQHLVTWQPAFDEVTVSSAFPADGAQGALIDSGTYSFTLVDGFTQKLDKASVSVTLNGQTLAFTLTTVGDNNTISGSLGAGMLELATSYSLVLRAKDTNGADLIFTSNFVTEDLITLMYAAPLTAATDELGMLVNVVQGTDNGAGRPTDDAGAERQIARLFGTVDFEASEVVPFINFNQDGDGASIGVVPGDRGMIEAGLMSELSSDNITWEVLTYIKFDQAGVVNMAVNSDDGFKVTHGKTPALDNEDGDETTGTTVAGKAGVDDMTLGIFSGGRGAATTSFRFVVPEPGIYPFRLLWYEGGGGANVEWWTNNGGVALVNDPSNSNAFQAFLTFNGEVVQVFDGGGSGGGDAVITSVSAAGGNISIEFTGTLQSGPTVNGPWTEVSATSPHSEAIATGAKFFRVVQ